MPISTNRGWGSVPRLGDPVRCDRCKRQVQKGQTGQGARDCRQAGFAVAPVEQSRAGLSAQAKKESGRQLNLGGNPKHILLLTYLTS